MVRSLFRAATSAPPSLQFFLQWGPIVPIRFPTCIFLVSQRRLNRGEVGPARRLDRWPLASHVT
jgi:hypothetical protein